MTLAEYASFVCPKVGQTDTTSVLLCKEYVKMRFRMIWDAHTWRDSLGLVSGLNADTTGVMAFPAGLERLLAIRSNGNQMLYPTDSPYVMQVDPKAFEEMGTPLAYEEFTDTANNNARMVRFFPIPAQSTAMLFFGKRTLVQLNLDTDVPVLRNIDNALIAYATGDMLERQRQYGKAQAKFQEAAAHLDLMRRIETEQSGRVQRVVPEGLEPDWGTSFGDDFELLDKASFSSPVSSVLSNMVKIITPLINGQAFIDIVFPTQITDYFFGSLSVENSVDPDPEAIAVETVTNRTPIGARVLLSGAPTSDNYILRAGIIP